MPLVELEIELTDRTKLEGKDALDYAFHRHCDTCTSETQPEPLCKVCKYMRLQHFIACLGPECFFFNMNLNTVSRIMRTTDCALCRVLSNGMQSYGIHRRQYEDCASIMGTIASPLNVSFKLNGLREMLMIHHNYIPSAAFGGTGSVPELPPLMNSLVDWDRIRGWVDHGLKLYPNISPLKSMPRGFRLIDVNKRRLASEVESSQNLSSDGFVALSYVWGDISASEDNALMQSNKQALEADGGLGQLPRTIEDAMTICKRLGRSYLWVDRFCIQQDEEHEKREQINAMADIFSAAEFTIINASGTDMNSPIAGVTGEREVFQSQAVLPGLVLTNVCPDDTKAVDDSKWGKRGWTYQEAVLSKKRLFFTRLEVWFECDDTSKGATSAREDYYANFHRTKDLRNKRTPRYNDEQRFDAFVRHLEGYTGRFFTHQWDILNAFMGIFKTLYPRETSHYGLPEPDFDRALLWKRVYGIEGNPISAREGFPSWSWASYHGQIAYDTTHAFVTTIVCWAYKKQTGEFDAVRSRNGSQRLTNIMVNAYDPQFHLLLAWWAGCIEAALPDDLEKELQVFLSSDESYISERLPTIEKIWDTIKGGRDIGPGRFQDLNIGLKPEDESTIGKLQHGVLLTRAQTAAFKIRWFKSTQHWIYDLEGGFQGGWGGELWLDSQSVPEDAITGTGLTTSQEEVELMGLSLSKCDITSPEDYYKNLIQSVHKQLHTGEGRQRTRMARINVLAIERPKGSLFWRRVGLGYVWFSHWVSANRTFKTIALEY